MYKIRIPPLDDNNSTIKILQIMKLLLYNGGNNPLDRARYSVKLVAVLRSICKSEQQAQAFFYFLEYGAATAWTLQVDLDLPEPTAYRIVKSLAKVGVIEPVFKLTKMRGSKGGPRPTVWGLLGCEASDIAEAINKHHRATSPRYRVAEEIAQDILDNYLKPRHLTEYSFSDLKAQVREVTQLRGTFLIDVANMAAITLKENEIKVWR